jgi:hypothetical protein
VKRILLLGLLVLLHFSCSPCKKAENLSPEIKSQCISELAGAALPGSEVEYVDFRQLNTTNTYEYKSIRYALIAYSDTAKTFDASMDLDMYLYNKKHNLIEKDTGSSSVSVINHFPQWTGEYNTQVHMVEGSGSYCYALFVY